VKEAVAEDSVVEHTATERAAAENAVTENDLPEDDLRENMDAASAADHVPVNLLSPRPVRERDFWQGFNLTSRMLHAAVLVFAVLLTALVVQRSGGRKDTVREHSRSAITAALTADAENRPSSGGRSATTASLLASSNRPTETGSSSVPASGSGSVSRHSSGDAHSVDSSHPTDSLRVYNSGKEVFRLPPSARHKDLSPQLKVKRAAVVEPLRIAAVSNATAEDTILHRVQPRYPEDARRKGIQGPVVVDVEIGRDGRVLEAKVVSGPPLLAQAATDPVKQWIFKPHRVDGHLVPMQTRITLNFKLAH
jgi:TonB family protein